MGSDSNTSEKRHCVDDDEYTVFFEICDKLWEERYYKNHLKSGTHTNTFYKRHGINN